MEYNPLVPVKKKELRRQSKFARLPQSMEEMLGLTRNYTAGVFDSGMGGLMVARALLDQRPDINIAYVADYLNLPYGDKQPAELSHFSANNIDFLLDQDSDFIALGCNSCNSVMGKGMLNCFDVEIYDLITSTSALLMEKYRPPQHMLIFGTPITIEMMRWRRHIEIMHPEIVLSEQASAELVPLLAMTGDQTAEISQFLRRRLTTHIEDGCDTLLMACTHFEMLGGAVAQMFPELQVVYPSECVAEFAVARLEPPAEPEQRGEIRFYVSRLSQKFLETASQMFGIDAREQTEVVDLNPDYDAMARRLG